MIYVPFYVLGNLLLKSAGTTNKIIVWALNLYALRYKKNIMEA